MANSTKTRADACDEPDPPPPEAGRRIRLTSADDVRVEMARVYREMRGARPSLMVKDGYTLIMALAQIGRITEATALESRLAALETKLKGGDQ